jgi:hypothetical protein
VAAGIGTGLYRRIERRCQSGLRSISGKKTEIDHIVAVISNIAARAIVADVAGCLDGCCVFSMFAGKVRELSSIRRNAMAGAADNRSRIIRKIMAAADANILIA